MSTGPCFRTEVAACIKYMPQNDWKMFILGASTSSFDQGKTNAVIAEWIRIYIDEANLAIAKLTEVVENGKYGEEFGRFSVIIRRWLQIIVLCNDALRLVGS